MIYAKVLSNPLCSILEYFGFVAGICLYSVYLHAIGLTAFQNIAFGLL